MSIGYRRTAESSPAGAARSSPGTAGGWGCAFVVLLLLSAGMASVPGGDDPTGTVRDFYTQHSGVVVAAQVLGLLAAATFVPFALTLRRTAVRRPMGALEIAGLGVAAAAVLTAVPVFWLTVVAGSGADGLVHGLAVASDLTDVVLFATIAFWATAVLGAAEPLWFKTLAGVVGLLTVARTLLLLAGSDLLELVAPLAFVALVAVLSTLLLVHRSPLGDH
jgi:hypothetical protein